jgi:hypothetical protein
MSLEHPFDAELKYRPGMSSIAGEGEGRLIGSGDGVVHGDRLDGTLRWTLFEQPGELVCPMNPILAITTGDGAERVEGRGYAPRNRPLPRARADGSLSAQPGHVDVVQRALASAGITNERFGAARLTHLSEGQRTLYRWILVSFARARPPQADELCDLASELDLQAEDTLDLFANLDLVHHDQATGQILVAYPFSARPRGHSVHINSTYRVEAMCAIDALGIAPMLQLPIEITSHDPLSGTEIWVRLDPDDGAWWEPLTAVVLAGSPDCDGPSFRGCCDVLNFFETDASANSYLANHPELAGFPISIPDAIEAGRTVFADLMNEH